MKKLITLLLCVTVLLSSFPAFASNADSKVDERYEEALSLVSMINPDVVVGDNTDTVISRGDFVRLAVGLYADYTSTGATNFKDVSKSLLPFVNYAAEIGMIDKGVSFYPDNEITYEMAMRIAVVMTGYMPRALKSGYAQTAKSIGLTSGLSGSSVTVRNAVVLLANVLKTEVLEQTSIGEKSQYETLGETFLEKYHDILWCEGVVTANMFTGLSSIDGAVSENHIVIGGYSYVCDDTSLLGYNVKAYYNKESMEISLIYKVDNVEITTENVIRLNGSSVTYLDEEDNEEEIELDEAYQLIYNGKAYTSDDFEDCFFADEGNVTFIDNNDDGVYEVVMVMEYGYIYVKNVDLYNERIFDYNSDTYLDFSESDCRYEVYYAYKYAVEKSRLYDIGEGAVITYCLTKDKKFCRIYISEGAVTGRMTELNTSDNTVKIGESYYKYNSYFERYYLDNVGNAGTFYMAYDGTVTAVNIGVDTSFKYGWVCGMEPADKRFGNNIKMKIFKQDGEFGVYNLAEKTSLDGDKKKCEDIYSEIGTVMNSGGIYERIIRYKLDENGNVSHIDTPETAEYASDRYKLRPEDNKLTKYYEGSYKYRTTPKSYGKFFLGSGAVIFSVPADSADQTDEKNYSIGSSVSDNNSATTAAFDLSKDGNAGVMVMNAQGDSTKLTDVTSGLICDIRNVYNIEDGESKKTYDIFYGGTYQSFTAKSEDIAKILADAEVGDIIRMRKNDLNEITAAALDYDLSKDKIVGAVTDLMNYFKGYVGYYNDSRTSVVMDEEATSLETVALSDYATIDTLRGYKAFVTAIKNKSGQITDVKVETIDKNSVLTFMDVGTKADKIVVRHRYAYPELAVIYRTIIR